VSDLTDKVRCRIVQILLRRGTYGPSMRTRVVRIGIALTLSAVAAGVTGPHWLTRGVLRDVTRVAVAPAQAAATVGLPGPAGVGNAHDRAAAADSMPAPAVLLPFAVALWLLAVGTPRRSSRPVRSSGARGPPRSAEVTRPS
jgi:hypothetical protein